MRKSTWLKAALYEVSKRFLKDCSTVRDLSIHTPFAAEIIGPPVAVLSARTLVTIWEDTALSSSVEEACSKERIFSAVAPGELAAMKLRITLINAGENTRFEVLPAVVAITCLDNLHRLSF